MTRSKKLLEDAETKLFVTPTAKSNKKFKQTKLDQFDVPAFETSFDSANVKSKRKPLVVLQVKEEQSTIELSVDQKRVFDLILQRKSVFFTGAAGSGKSYVLRVLKDVMEKLKLKHKTSFTASTGVAASNICGMTINSWAGVGRATDPLDQILTKVMRNIGIKKRWKETELLVIDEVSMISADLFDTLSAVGKKIRGDNRPFGGMQVILCGDFFQLPPIGLGGKVHFCFESDTWRQLFQGGGLVVLNTVFRQKDDVTFLNILNEMRVGALSRNSVAILNAKSKESGRIVVSTTALSNEICPTKLFSTNKDVDGFNETELSRLTSVSYIYNAVDEGSSVQVLMLKECTKAPQRLELKVGAQVMLLKNISTAKGLVNGACGTVVAIDERRDVSSYFPHLPTVRFETQVGSERMEETILISHETWDIQQGDEILASRIQLPLMLAWAISIHKSQGMTIPLLEVSFNNIFEYGQGYVALSRATCLAGLTLRSFNARAIKAHPKVIDFYRHLEEQNCGKKTRSSNQPNVVVKIEGESDGTAAGMVRTSVLDLAADFDRSSSSRPGSGTSVAVVEEPPHCKQEGERCGADVNWSASSTERRTAVEQEEGELTLMSILDGISTRTKAGCNSGGKRSDTSAAHDVQILTAHKEQKSEPSHVLSSQMHRISPLPQVVLADQSLVPKRLLLQEFNDTPLKEEVFAAPVVAASSVRNVNHVTRPSIASSTGPSRQETLYAAFTQTLANHPSAVQTVQRPIAIAPRGATGVQPVFQPADNKDPVKTSEAPRYVYSVTAPVVPPHMKSGFAGQAPFPPKQQLTLGSSSIQISSVGAARPSIPGTAGIPPFSAAGSRDCPREVKVHELPESLKRRMEESYQAALQRKRLKEMGGGQPPSPHTSVSLLLPRNTTALVRDFPNTTNQSYRSSGMSASPNNPLIASFVPGTPKTKFSATKVWTDPYSLPQLQQDLRVVETFQPKTNFSPPYQHQQNGQAYHQQQPQRWLDARGSGLGVDYCAAIRVPSQFPRTVVPKQTVSPVHLVGGPRHAAAPAIGRGGDINMCTLSDDMKRRIEVNKQRALWLRQQKKSGVF